MSRSSGTISTSFNATYSPPKMIPGYGGHVPYTSFDYGMTFGNQSEKYFTAYRNDLLNSSKSLNTQGGRYPCNDKPTNGYMHRQTIRDQFLYAPKYELRSYNYDRDLSLRNFYNHTQEHRQQYLDRTGQKQPHKEFIIPITNEKMTESFLPYTSMKLRHRSEINIPYNKTFQFERGVRKVNEYKLF